MNRVNVEISPAQWCEIPAIIDLLSAAMPVDGITSARFTRQVLLDPSHDADGFLVAKSGNTIAGVCVAAARNPPLDENDAQRGFITLLAVDARFRRQGIGTKLIAAAEARLAARGRSVVLVSPYGPGYFTPGIDIAAYPAAVNLFGKLGYEQASRPISMQTDLWQLKEPEFVEQTRRKLALAGVKIEPYRVELTRPILDFAQSEFGLDWFTTYHQTMQSILRGDDAGRIVAAHQDGKVLGISHHDGERFGPIGVAASARGRGLGHLLMFATLGNQKRAGLRCAWFLWSDDRTAARLYHAGGFKEIRRFVVMRKGHA